MNKWDVNTGTLYAVSAYADLIGCSLATLIEKEASRGERCDSIYIRPDGVVKFEIRGGTDVFSLNSPLTLKCMVRLHMRPSPKR